MTRVRHAVGHEPQESRGYAAVAHAIVEGERKLEDLADASFPSTTAGFSMMRPTPMIAPLGG